MEIVIQHRLLNQKVFEEVKKSAINLATCTKQTVKVTVCSDDLCKQDLSTALYDEEFDVVNFITNKVNCLWENLNV